jgi:hypothetical protein
MGGQANVPDDRKMTVKNPAGSDGSLSEAEQREIKDAVRGTRITELWFSELSSPAESPPRRGTPTARGEADGAVHVVHDTVDPVRPFEPEKS